MRCQRCNRRVNRKRWKNGVISTKCWTSRRCCGKCHYTEIMCTDKGDCDQGTHYAFSTQKYVVCVGHKGTNIWHKKSNQMIMHNKTSDGRNMFYYDCGQFVMMLNKRIARNAMDVDIERYIALM